MHGCINPKQNAVLKKIIFKKENTEVIKTLITIVNCKHLLIIDITEVKNLLTKEKKSQKDPPFSTMTHNMLPDNFL